jgi:hypothetical protein
VDCQTALTAPQAGEAGIVAARMRADCERRVIATNTMDIRPWAIAAAQAEREANAQLLPGGTAPPGTPTWRSIGPTRNNWDNFVFVGFPTIHSTGTNGGRIRTVLQDPTNPDRVYVLSAGGGLWRTDNFSKNKPDWQPLTDGVVSTSGGAVAFGATPNVLYLGIGDPFGRVISVTGVMVRSVDGGQTWSPFVTCRVRALSWTSRSTRAAAWRPCWSPPMWACFGRSTAA